MTRASGSVVKTRGVASLPPRFFLIAATSGSRSRHHRGVAGRERGGGRRAGDLDKVDAGGEHEPLEGLTASKRRSAGGGANAGAVLGDAMEIDEVVFHEPRRELGHELAEHVTVVAAEVVEAVIGDRDAAAQPAVGGGSPPLCGAPAVRGSSPRSLPART